ncbi:hypothetical protein [Acinetobacter venetianus]|uniref:hypothetical protein n=1 Tax=Acinetobacter venetianus TaxID=52133 RepID=UPI003A8D64C7
MREWSLVAELAGLDGMANGVAGVSQKTKRKNWLRRLAPGASSAFGYHISNFHAEVKKQLIERYVRDPGEVKALVSMKAPTKNDAPEPSNVSKIVPLAKVRDWCELPVFDVCVVAGVSSLVRREFLIDKLIIPQGIYLVISDNPTYESFEINHKNGRNFKIIGKAIAPVFKKIF